MPLKKRSDGKVSVIRSRMSLSCWNVPLVRVITKDTHNDDLRLALFKEAYASAKGA